MPDNKGRHSRHADTKANTIRQIALADLRHRRAGGRDGGPVGDTYQNTAECQHTGERHDKRREPDVKYCRCAAEQAHHRADGKIDLGGNNHKHHADRENAGDGGLAQQVRDITRAQISAFGSPGEKQHNGHDSGDHHEYLEIHPF